MITIQLVRSFDGRLVGKTVSDRWNLDVLGIQYVDDDRNQASVKKLRRLHGSHFRFAVSSGTTENATPLERESLGSRFFARLFGQTA